MLLMEENEAEGKKEHDDINLARSTIIARSTTIMMVNDNHIQ